MGYRALTVPYFLPQQKDMMERVLADMRRGNIPACLVKGNGGVEVWRQTRSARNGVSPQTTGTLPVGKAAAPHGHE